MLLCGRMAVFLSKSTLGSRDNLFYDNGFGVIISTREINISAPGCAKVMTAILRFLNACCARINIYAAK